MSNRNKWTGDLVGRMHNAGITRQELADKLGVGKAYISMILNCDRTPKNAEETLNRAFEELLAEKNI